MLSSAKPSEPVAMPNTAEGKKQTPKKVDNPLKILGLSSNDVEGIMSLDNTGASLEAMKSR